MVQPVISLIGVLLCLITPSTLTVGSPGLFDSIGSGAAYIFGRNKNTSEWILRQKIRPDDGTPSDNFGYSIAIFNNTIVIGAYRDDDKGLSSGSAYIFERDDKTNGWKFRQKLAVPDDGAVSDEFGSNVASCI